jgi:histidine ammonia-lyase
MDFLCIAVSELANISERRTYLLISGQRGLPAFLAKEAGLNSGYMIPQYTAAGIVSMNKQLCTPSSADSIVSSNGQEDHVSMGANAAVKCFTVIDNSYTVAGIELLTAAQALDFRRPLRSSSAVDSLHKSFRISIPSLEKDTIMQPLIASSRQFIAQYFQA